MKVLELRKLDRSELVQKCNDQVKELKKIKFSLKSGEINADNINKARVLKKEIAQTKTVLRELALVEGPESK